MKKAKKIKKEVVTPEIKEETKQPDSRTMVEKIIELSQVKNFIEVQVIELPLYAYDYMDYINEEKTIFKNFNKFIQTGTFQVSCSVTQDQITKLDDDWNIDVKDMINTALTHEAAANISKHVASSIGKIAHENYLKDYTSIDRLKDWAYKFSNKFRFKKTDPGSKIPYINAKEYKKKIKVDNVKDLLNAIVKESNTIDFNGKLGYGNFAICSVKTGCSLQMHSEYTVISEKQELKSSAGMPYPIGMIAGITIYVDPYMLYADTNVYIGCKTQLKYPGIKLFIYVYGTESVLQVEGVGAPKMIFRIRYALVPVGESANHLYRKIEYKENPKKILL